LPGTLRNLGAPSSMTIAQNDGTVAGPGAVTPAPTAPAGTAEKSTALVWLGIAASVLSVIK
jgi:hypothetical protein